MSIEKKELDYIKIKENISRLQESIGYIGSVMDEIRNISNNKLQIIRELNKLKKAINETKLASSVDENLLSMLIENEKEISNQLNTLSEIELNFEHAIDDMYDFVQQYNFRPEKLKKHSDREIVYLYYLHLLFKKYGFTRSIIHLHDFILTVENSEFVEIINSQFSLTGFNKFYLKNNTIRSIYCDDLKTTLLNHLYKSNFKFLQVLFQKHFGDGKGQITLLDLLYVIVLHVNKRTISN